MIRLWLLAALAVSVAGAPARAEEGDPLTGTLAAIQQRGRILIGYRTGTVPFSFLNAAGQPIGFSLDLCGEIASDVAQALHVDLLEPGAPAWQQGLRMTYVPVEADERLPKIVSGAIDLECGATTATAERAKTVAFSPVFFLAGTKLLVVRGAASSYRDLAGRTVAAIAGTTNDEAVRRLAPSVSPPFRVVDAPTRDAALDMVASGKADAMASDDILLTGLLATRPDAARFAIVGDYLTYEPYAIAFRRDDPAFASLIKASFERMSASGFLGSRYDRWFIDRLPTGQTLNLPISPYLSQMFDALGRAD